jgi:hypothetical protein
MKKNKWIKASEWVGCIAVFSMILSSSVLAVALNYAIFWSDAPPPPLGIWITWTISHMPVLIIPSLFFFIKGNKELEKEKCN